MAQMLTYLPGVLLLMAVAKSSAQISSSCTKKDRAAILLDAANEFISKARDSPPTCLFGFPHSEYTAYNVETAKPSTLLETASSLVTAAKNSYSTKSQEGGNYKLVCYFSSWAYYRKGEGRFDFSGFQPHLCTHAIYALAKLEDNKMASAHPDIDLPESMNGYKKFNELKQKNPNLKTLLAIGGWAMGSAPFSTMAEDKDKRATFIESVAPFLKEYGFDGLDMDWEYPSANGGKPQDKQNFVTLLRELKAALHPQGLMLTSTVSGVRYFVDTAYDIPAISKELDQIHLLSFNFHGSWQPVTGFNSPLYAPPQASMEDQELTVDFAVNYWLENGAPREKLILGMAFFGRTFKLANSAENGVRAPANGAGARGRLNGDAEMLGFNEVCENLNKMRWATVWDPDAWTPYAYKGDQWVGYDDMRSLNAKVDYLMRKGLGGGFVWSIDSDDFRGHCYGKKYPLLRAVANKLLS